MKMIYYILIPAVLVVGLWLLLNWAEHQVSADFYRSFTFHTDANLSPDIFMTDIRTDSENNSDSPAE